MPDHSTPVVNPSVPTSIPRPGGLTNWDVLRLDVIDPAKRQLLQPDLARTQIITRTARNLAVDNPNVWGAPIVSSAIPERGHFWWQVDPKILTSPTGPIAALVSEHPEEIGQVIGAAGQVAPALPLIKNYPQYGPAAAGAAVAAGREVLSRRGGDEDATPLSVGSQVVPPLPLSPLGAIVPKAEVGGGSTPRTTVCEQVWEAINLGTVTVEVAKVEYPQCFDGE